MVIRNFLIATTATAGVFVLHQVPATGQLTFGGVNSTTLQSRDVFGNPLPPQTYQTNTIIIIKPALEVFDPFTGAVTREANPFNLFISPTTDQISAIGGVSVWSAVETSGLSGGTFLQQFWQLQLDSSTTFRGVYTDSQFGNLANQPNLINAFYPLPGGIPSIPFPYPFAQGTQLVGQVASDLSQIRIQISGSTSDLATPFFSDITAVLLNQPQAASSVPSRPDLAAAPSSSAQAAPEPSTLIGTLVFGCLGLGQFLKKRLNP